MAKPEIKDWYEHEHPQSIFVMFTKELKIVWSPSGNNLRHFYLQEPEAYLSGPLELPIPDEVKDAIWDYMDNF